MTITEVSSLSRAVAEMSVKPVTACQEYLKNPDLKKEDIESLRNWVLSQPQFPVPTEEQLIRFYHSCYYDMEATKSCMQIYYNLRSNTPEFFNDRDISRPELKQALEALFYSSLPVKDPNGYQIVLHGLRQYEASKYNFCNGVKLLAMAIDACMMVEGTVPGFIFLFDMKGVKLSHLTRLSFTFLKKFFTYIQEGNPIRLKAIHVVNTLPIVDKIMFMIKPFMRKELLELIHYHSSDLSEIQAALPKSCLPKDYGGDLPSITELHEKYTDWMEKMKPLFDEEEKYRINDKQNRKDSSSEINIRNLSID
ncbi:alpha-tocopherol transfer protein-like [Halyomorpha halys]|uniref:alpha-tocopherol transfer protein-like n=1 Tax=Halyomorpha halys TaxID=286706 RepID=UPI0006D4D3A4|nr:alpha-tocopherol transfer protein-like isoform X2 [Halyomorpha halys]